RRSRLGASEVGGRGSGPGLRQGDQGKVGRPGPAAGGHGPAQPGDGPGPRRDGQDLPGDRQGGGGAGGGPGRPDRPVAAGGGGGGVEMIPPRRYGGQARALPSSALTRRVRLAVDEARQGANRRVVERDLDGGLNAQAHAEQRL